MSGDLLTTSETAHLLRVNQRTVTRWIRLGLLPAMKLPSGQYRISRQAIEKLREQLQGEEEER